MNFCIVDFLFEIVFPGLIINPPEILARVDSKSWVKCYFIFRLTLQKAKLKPVYVRAFYYRKENFLLIETIHSCSDIYS